MVLEILCCITMSWYYPQWEVVKFHYVMATLIWRLKHICCMNQPLCITQD